jgi:hypothetical protein
MSTWLRRAVSPAFAQRACATLAKSSPIWQARRLPDGLDSTSATGLVRFCTLRHPHGAFSGLVATRNLLMLHFESGDILISNAGANGHGVAPGDHFNQGLALSLRERWPAWPGTSVTPVPARVPSGTGPDLGARGSSLQCRLTGPPFRVAFRSAKGTVFSSPRTRYLDEIAFVAAGRETGSSAPDGRGPFAERKATLKGHTERRT